MDFLAKIICFSFINSGKIEQKASDYFLMAEKRIQVDFLPLLSGKINLLLSV